MFTPTVVLITNAQETDVAAASSCVNQSKRRVGVWNQDMSLANQAALLASFAALPGFEECAAQQRALDERATYLQRRRPLSRVDALAVALFSRGTWAQRYPVKSFDLGEDAALFLADWLRSRHVGPTAENMDAALQEWQGGAFVARIWAAIAGLQ